MYGLTLERITERLGGELTGEVSDRTPEGACIDTRKLVRDELFFALPGEARDGHQYVDEAREKGALGAVVQRIPEGFVSKAFPLIIVKDTTIALRQLALAQRQLFNGPVIAITGSTGKTSTKDMLTAVLAEKGPVLSTIGNYNNELGLPLTLLAAKEGQWAFILEMGMRGLGEIDELASIARPNFGLITNIGHTHQERLGSQEKIAQAKAELLSHVPVGGSIVLNWEDHRILQPWLSNIRCDLSWFGLEQEADFRASNIRLTDETGSAAFDVWSGKEKLGEISLALPGRHHVLNALSVIALAKKVGLSWEDIRNGLQKTKMTAMRQEFIPLTQRGVLLINDAYNANPLSMAAALEVLQTMARGRRTIAVLGDMYELGDYALEAHDEVGRKAKELDISYLITVGQLGVCIAQGAEKSGFAREKIKSCQNNEEAICYIKELLTRGDVLLVKGSRGLRMEEIVTALRLS